MRNLFTQSGKSVLEITFQTVSIVLGGILTVIILFDTKSTWADDTGKSEGFFPKNFAEAPGAGFRLDTDKEIGGENVDDTTIRKEQELSIGSDKGQNEGNVRNDSRKQELMDDDLRYDKDLVEQSSDLPPLDQNVVLRDIPKDVQDALLKPQYISTFIECDSAVTCSEHLSLIHERALASKLPVRSLYVVNIFKGAMLRGAKEEGWDKVNKPLPQEVYSEYMFKTTYVSEPPTQYPITQLPAWVIGTPSGEVLLEGIDNPAELLREIKAAATLLESGQG